MPIPSSPEMAIKSKRISERLWENILDKQIPMEEILRVDALRKFFDKYIQGEYAANATDKAKLVQDLDKAISFWLKIETKLRPLYSEHKHKPPSETFVEISQLIINDHLLPTSATPLPADVLEKHQQSIQQMAVILQQPANHMTQELFATFDALQQTIAQAKILDVYNQFRESSTTFRDMKLELEQLQKEQQQNE